MKAPPRRPNPLTDELTSEAKAELAAVFAEMKAWLGPLRLGGGDRPHLITERLQGR